MIRYNYNRQVTPPAPFAHVSVGRPVDETVVADLPAQLDTAADMTVIPWQIVESLQLVQLDELSTMGFGGHVASVPTFLVRLAIRQCDPVVVEVLASRDEPHVLLGRDVLNHVHIVLNGPLLVLEIG